MAAHAEAHARTGDWVEEEAGAFYSGHLLPRAVPWRSWAEWDVVAAAAEAQAHALGALPHGHDAGDGQAQDMRGQGLQQRAPGQEGARGQEGAGLQARAARLLQVWRARPAALPAAVEAHAAVAECLAACGGGGGGPAALGLGLALVRLVNATADQQQPAAGTARSVAALAGQAGLPRALADLRHAATHGALPGPAALQQAGRAALAWLAAAYWRRQAARRAQAAARQAHAAAQARAALAQCGGADGRQAQGRLLAQAAGGLASLLPLLPGPLLPPAAEAAAWAAGLPLPSPRAHLRPPPELQRRWLPLVRSLRHQQPRAPWLLARRLAAAALEEAAAGPAAGGEGRLLLLAAWLQLLAADERGAAPWPAPALAALMARCLRLPHAWGRLLAHSLLPALPHDLQAHWQRLLRLHAALHPAPLRLTALRKGRTAAAAQHQQQQQQQEQEQERRQRQHAGAARVQPAALLAALEECAAAGAAGAPAPGAPQEAGAWRPLATGRMAPVGGRLEACGPRAALCLVPDCPATPEAAAGAGGKRRTAEPSAPEAAAAGAVAGGRPPLKKRRRTDEAHASAPALEAREARARLALALAGAGQ